MRETWSGDVTTSWETAKISSESAGVIIRYAGSPFSPLNGGWMFHCDAKTCQRISSWDTFDILIHLLSELAGFMCNGQLLPFSVSSQIQRRGLW